MTSTDLDPRFDPRYQRGYDAARHEPVPDAEIAEPVADADASAPPFVSESTADESDPEWEESPDEADRRRNPYVVALFSLPVLLLGASVYLLFLYTERMSAMYSSPYVDDYLVITIVPMVVPALIVTAFASLVVVFARLALGGARRA